MFRALSTFDKLTESDKVIQIYGRIASIGKRKRFWFVTLRSGSSVEDFPVVVDKSLLKEAPSLYSTLFVEGKITRSPDGDKIEMHVGRVLFYGHFDSSDLRIREVSDAVLRKRVSQRLLTEKYQSIMYSYTRIEDILHQVSRDNGLLRVRAPFITFSDCEGGGETFELTSTIPNFFKKKAYLTVSGQVDEETITSRLLCPTYIFGPSFRADPSKTKWHACEFYHYEPEIPFINLSGLIALEESIIMCLLTEILCDDQLSKCIGDPSELKRYCTEPFAQISYTDAIKRLSSVEDRTFEVAPKWGIDLTKEHERYLCEEIFNKPTFVFEYPSAIKSFYMLQCEPFVDEDVSNESLQTCEGVDLLVPGIGELCGGSIREYRYDILLENMKRKGLNPKDYREYLSLRKQGTFPHGGFGMGFDRFIMMVLGLDSIRDVAPFPRHFRC